MFSTRPEPERARPDQESVWDYPRPPRLEPVTARLAVVLGGETIAETTRGYRVLETDNGRPVLRVVLKYAQGGQPVIRELKRVSSPGLRKYVGVGDIPRVRNGLGMAILSTSHGLMSDAQARRSNTGGELLALVW